MIARSNEKHIQMAANDAGTLFTARSRIHPAHTNIYHQGDAVSGFYRVNSGVVMVYRLLENSQRQISGFFTHGEFFGLSADDIYHDSAITVSTASVTKLSMADVSRCPELQEQLFRTTCSQLADAQTLITALTKKSASEKIAYFLVSLAQRQHRDGNDIDIRLPMSRRDIADYLGLTIETVSRRLTALKSEGVISLPNRDTVHINRFDDLQAMAGAQ